MNAGPLFTFTCLVSACLVSGMAWALACSVASVFGMMPPRRGPEGDEVAACACGNACVLTSCVGLPSPPLYNQSCSSELARVIVSICLIRCCWSEVEQVSTVVCVRRRPLLTPLGAHARPRTRGRARATLISEAFIDVTKSLHFIEATQCSRILEKYFHIQWHDVPSSRRLRAVRGAPPEGAGDPATIGLR